MAENECQRLADQMRRALRGDTWQGPAWRDLLDDIDVALATRRPIPSVHTIAEIVQHVTTWHDVVRQRLDGDNPKVSAAQDWPNANLADEKAWRAAVARLHATGEALCDTIARFPAARLHEDRPGAGETWYELAIGSLQHEVYHAGQVGMLRKAVTSA
jgi:hypothetical protein